MPYIHDDNVREALREGFVSPETTGELNYCITTLIDGYIAKQGKNYDNINAVIGVLECAKLELYRQIAAPYEDKKMSENGDVYTIR